MYGIYVYANTHNETISRGAPYIIGDANKNMVFILITKQLIHNVLVGT
jgi:hypothetical protein